MFNKSKRLISLLLCLATVLALLPMAVFAADSKTIYVQPNSNWLTDDARFAAYFFTDGVGDVWVDCTADGDGLYSVAVPAGGYKNVIFCRMNPGTTENGWSTKWNQTKDLTIPTDNKVVYVVDGWDNGNGQWIEKGGETVEIPVTYYIRGDFNNWGTTDAMTKNADGTYSVTISLTAGVYGYKAADDGYSFQVPNSTENLTLNVVSDCDVTFTLNVEEMTVTASGSGLSTEVPTIDYYIRGDFNAWGTGNQMTANEDGTYSITITLEAGTYEYKAADEGFTNNIPESGNLTLKVDTACDVTFTLDPTTKTLTATGTGVGVYVPNITYYIRGDFNTWGTDNQMTANDDGTFSVTIALEPGTYEYKAADADFGNGVPESGNLTVVVETACDVTFTLNPTAKTLTATGDGLGTLPEMEIDYIVAVGDGTGNFMNNVNWDPASETNKMTKDGNVYSITFENVAAGTYGLKFAANGGWDINWGCEGFIVGEWSDVAINGNNGSLTVEKNNSTVTLALDFSNADLTNGSGVKVKVTVTSDGYNPGDNDGPIDWGAFDKLETPSISKLENTASGIKLTWNAVADAAGYRVFMKTADGWSAIDTTSGNSYVYQAATSGVEYTFSVCCINEDGENVSDYNTTGWSQTYVAQPSISKFENTASGIKITWNAVAGAGKYRIFVKSGSSWKNAGTVSGTSFTYADAKSGTAYTFTIRAMDAAGKNFVSSYNTSGWKQTYVAQPSISKFENTASGIKITWKAVSGAGKYRIFVKSGSSWKNAGTVSGTSFTYTGAATGKTYTFTIRAMDAAGKNYVSSYNTTGWKQTYVAQPSISKFENTASGIKITWKAVSGAGKYRIFVKSGSSWKAAGTVTGTSFTYTGAATGKTYAFTIRAMDAAGKNYVSSYNTTGWKQTYVAQPSISKLENTASGIKITWKAVSGAGKYRIYVKSGNSWKAAGTVSGTSFTYTGVKSGTTYTFTIRAMDKNGKNFVSSYNTSGWKQTYVAQPSISKGQSVSNGIKLSWNKVSGAGKYCVYVKTSKGWSVIGTTTGTSLTWTGAKKGTKYTFTIRAMDKSGKNYVSSFNSTGWTFKR